MLQINSNKGIVNEKHNIWSRTFVKLLGPTMYMYNFGEDKHNDI